MSIRRRRVSRVIRSARLVRARQATTMAVGSPIPMPTLTDKALTLMAVAFTLVYGTQPASKYGSSRAVRSPTTSLLATLTRLPGQLPRLSGLPTAAT